VNPYGKVALYYIESWDLIHASNRSPLRRVAGHGAPLNNVGEHPCID